MTTQSQELSKRQTRADQLAAFERRLAAPDETMQTIFHHLANGGHLFDLLDLWGCAYNDILRWIVEDDTRRNLYNSAMQTQSEYVKREVLETLRKIARFDIRTLYDENGALLHPKSWPPEAAFAVAGVDVDELYEWTGEKGEKERELVGYARKVKLRDNLKAFEMIGKNLALFIERHEHTHKHTLEALVMASLGPAAPAAPERPVINSPTEKRNLPQETHTGFFDSRAQESAPTLEPHISSIPKTEIAANEPPAEKESGKNFPEKIEKKESPILPEEKSGEASAEAGESELPL